MNKLKPLIFSVLLVSMYSCGGEVDDTAQKKQQIQEYKQEIKDLQSKVKALEQEVAQADPNYAAADRNATLVTTIPVKQETFRHFVEVRGEVTSRQNVTISAQVPAMVNRVPATKGQVVRKGEVLVVQDAETIRTNIAEVQTSLELAETRFKRQSNLWDQNIGSEFQFLEAKNAKESLERKLSTLNAQLNDYIIRAPFSGTIDEVFVKEGEMAQPGVPMVRLVSMNDMYIEADISETYLGQFKKGDSVEVVLPSLNEEINTTISAVGQVINQNNRTFTIEVKIPSSENKLKPNMLAELRLKDFEKSDAFVVPTNLIQSDNQGDFVYVAVQESGTDKFVADKKHIQRGKTYNNETMVKTGLSGDERIIDQGFRNVAEGVNVRITDNNQSLNASAL
ncbi:efflux RND transporter periplasmic adaptor subunit [Porifericola rhodea]|uniref:efflux RND transporter periplasmic adaptor subunit n=1 Tax=Porifericola rhodea TaxID=930972 RepID=UPI002666C5EA|nr:efflux RND transporter periplasmic adaptor subunit [Porifericola rhodea]WKN31200.1 efflux RND transporter periplasmic adaptor subunit [Porifericola rhodea]